MKYLICLFFLSTITLFGQTDIQLGWLPKVNLSSKINPKLKWINSIETREKIYDENYTFTHSLIDISTLISYKTNLNQKLTLGYIFRFEDKNSIHRFVQQYNFIKNLNTLILGHRIGFEQHFSKTITSFYRLRYRFTAQKPLNGEKLDSKEFYLKLGNEYVWNITTKNIETRFSPYLGYVINKDNKLEIGTEYRIGNILDILNKHRFWLRTTWYINI